MPVTEFAQRLVRSALGEHSSYSGVLETDARLRKRIYKSYLADLKKADPGDKIGWNMPSDITKWPWSATFVSWCILDAGAGADEFDFSVRHAIFTKQAISNSDAATGLFRAHPIDSYALNVGDLIVANRDGGRVSYADARKADSYNGHSAIVVELVSKGGKRYAVTIGGNERDSIRRTEVELSSAGKVKQRTVDPYICIIQNLKDRLAEAQPLTGLLSVTKSASTGLPASFKGHGTFVYNVSRTIADYGSSANVVAALMRAGMQHCWVRVHGRRAHEAATKKVTKAFIAAAKDAGIQVAGWGWCQGEDPNAEAALAIREMADHGLSDYIADIEPGVNDSQWLPSEVGSFAAALRKGLKGGIALSSFGLVDWHDPHVLAAALPYIDAVAPQVYWFNHPNKRMVQQFKRSDGSSYAVDRPEEYVDLCLDRWERWAQKSPKPLILTGQAYWGEGNFTKEQSESKLIAFLQQWSDYGRIAGVNWWHFGGGSAMNHAMFEAIVSAGLGNKTYG